ncbi:TPR-like protein [Lojkania enalia]|uniref:TPR-like protein n=1 Tax=Lojkania enalia TaxID=147567 RepID=A0A9P4KF77_9PLEO|nr:TPR-like protein [Didymosphaeria enalia]
MKRTSTIERDMLETESPQTLIDEVQGLAPRESQMSKVWTTVLPKLKPILLGLNNFAAVIAWSLGMNGRVAAIIWGSMRLILKVARPVFPELITLLAELQTVLPKAQLSEQELPLPDTLETALLDMYTEISFSMPMLSHSSETTQMQPLVAAHVDEIVDITRLSKESYSAETVKATNSLQELMIADSGKPCHMILFGENLKFLDRSNEIADLKAALDPSGESQGLKAISICVGSRSFSLRSKLGLPPKEVSGEDDYQSVQKFRDWLNNSGKPFLLIFDNVDDVRILSQIWPASAKGSIIITTRAPAVAAKRTKKVLQLKTFGVDVAVSILCELTGFEPINAEDADAAKEICRLIGGLPLAMTHMSSFIQYRGYSYLEFLAMYKEHSERIFKKDQAQVDYEHTLNTVWDLSLESLSPNARSLLNLLSFFDPDLIPEGLLIETRADILEPRLKFLKDEFEFGDAVSELMTKTSLLNRFTLLKSLSLHRLVKFTMFIRIREEERTLYLDSSIQLLYHAFPNTWDQRGEQQGHGWRYWGICSAVVAHLSSLMALQKQYDLKATNTDIFAELVFRIGTYLWESEQPTSAKTFFEYGLSLDIDSTTRIAAQAYRLLGHIGLDVAQPRGALAAYQKALAAREKLEKPNSPAIAEVYDSIACSYSEIGDVPQALEALNNADAINFKHYGGTSARTQAIYSLAYLRGHQPDKALEALHLCWQLQNKTQEQIAESKYPKHAGDIILLARIQYELGNKADGQRLASRTITIRRGIFGAKGPRVADSIFIVARMLGTEGEYVVAAKMLREIIEMSQDMGEMNGHLARALWFLASIEETLGNPTEAENLKKEAKREREKIQGREAPDEDTDDAFMALVGWMLW